jgi:hypothetical protein
MFHSNFGIALAEIALLGQVLAVNVRGAQLVAGYCAKFALQWKQLDDRRGLAKVLA